MANTWKPAANVPKQPLAVAQPKVTAATKENILPCLSMATRLALALKPSQKHASNSVRNSEMDGEKDTKLAALIACLWG